MTIKEMCEYSNIEYNKDHPKRSLQKLKQLYLIEQIDARQYNIIRELTEDEIISCGKFGKYFHINENIKHDSGIYKIQLNNDVYIGQTCDFYKRFKQHYYLIKTNNTASKTYELLHNGGVMEVLEIVTDKKERFIREAYWSQYYLSIGYNVLNSFNVLYHKKNKNKHIVIKKENYNKAIELLKRENLL